MSHWTTVKINAAPATSERPICPNCEKRLRPYWVRVSETGNSRDGYKVEHKWDGQYHGYGAFCTLRCCERYSNRLVDAEVVTTARRLVLAMLLKYSPAQILNARIAAHESLKKAGVLK